MPKIEPLYIPPKKKYDGAIRTAIYCRVSSHKKAQIESLAVQISALTNMVAYMPEHVLVDTYIDIASGSSVDGRPGFQRLIKDCKNGKVKYVITKSASRFGREIVDAMTAIRQITAAGAKVYFVSENIDSDNPEMQVHLAIHLAVAEQENYSRSKNIQWGLNTSAGEGTSKIYSKICYGYKHDREGNLVIKEDEAENVRLIFRLYLDGHSVIGIINELHRRRIKSPSGKENWNKRYIEKMLRNEKYVGTSTIATQSNTYVYSNHHPGIISQDTFDGVQNTLARRSNISVTPDGTVTRKSTKYSGKTVIRQTTDIDQLLSDMDFDK